MMRSRILCSSRTISAILSTVIEKGEAVLRRKGVKMEFRISQLHRIDWRARIAKDWQQGNAPDVTQAVREIERRAAL